MEFYLSRVLTLQIGNMNLIPDAGDGNLFIATIIYTTPLYYTCDYIIFLCSKKMMLLWRFDMLKIVMFKL